MADKIMYFPNNDTQNYPFYKSGVEMFKHSTNQPTNQNCKSIPKAVKPTNKKTLL